MQILDLKLTNFRNYEKLQLEFINGNNLIIGNNGMGKTNLVEAIYVLGFTKSFRGSTEQIIIKKDEKSTKIEGNIKSIEQGIIYMNDYILCTLCHKYICNLFRLFFLCDTNCLINTGHKVIYVRK